MTIAAIAPAIAAITKVMIGKINREVEGSASAEHVQEAVRTHESLMGLLQEKTTLVAAGAPEVRSCCNHIVGRVEGLASAARRVLGAAAQKALLSQSVSVSRSTAELRPKQGGATVSGQSWYDAHSADKDILQTFNETLGALQKPDINTIEKRINTLSQAVSLFKPAHTQTQTQTQTQTRGGWG